MGCFKSKQKKVAVPWPLASLSRQEWIAWRNCFLTYMDEKGIPAHKRGLEFLKYIGNLGPEISTNFYYHNEASETDVETLLFKYEVYFIFGGRKRHSNESVEEYIKALKDVAEKTAKSNTDRVVKEKILQDLKYEKVFERFSELNPTFSKVTDYESLPLHELIFIWEESGKSTDVRKYLAALCDREKDAFKHINTKDCCNKCGDIHEDKTCKAAGETCWKCEEFDHFAKCCSKPYVLNCYNCGLSHVEGKCKAISKVCSKCKRITHFSWQCPSNVSFSCDFCGQSHEGKDQCPAIKNVCYNCHKTGHFSFKCQSRRNSKTKK